MQLLKRLKNQLNVKIKHLFIGYCQIIILAFYYMKWLQKKIMKLKKNILKMQSVYLDFARYVKLIFI